MSDNCILATIIMHLRGRFRDKKFKSSHQTFSTWGCGWLSMRLLNTPTVGLQPPQTLQQWGHTIPIHSNSETHEALEPLPCSFLFTGLFSGLWLQKHKRMYSGTLHSAPCRHPTIPWSLILGLLLCSHKTYNHQWRLSRVLHTATSRSWGLSIIHSNFRRVS